MVVSGVGLPPVAVPDHSTTEVGANLLPSTINVNCGVPAGVLGGISDALAGAGLLMYSPQLGRMLAAQRSSQIGKRDLPSKVFTPEAVGR